MNISNKRKRANKNNFFIEGGVYINGSHEQFRYHNKSLEKLTNGNDHVVILKPNRKHFKLIYSAYSN